MTEKLFKNILGQPQSNYKADDPGDNLQYIVAHDGLTLFDTISHNAKLDVAIPEQKAELVKRIKMGNFVVLTSQGIAFMHGGQERGRTKPNLKNSQNETIGKFVRNSYDSADNINQFVWTLDSDFQGVLDYTASMIALRKAHDVFRIGDMAKINRAATLLPCPEDNRLTLAYTLEWNDGTWLIVMNAEKKAMTFETGLNLSAATVFADQRGGIVAGDDKLSGATISGTKLSVEPLTSIVIRVK